MKTKFVSSIFALVLLTIVVSTYSTLSKLNLAQVNSQKVVVNGNLFEFATAATPNVRIAPASPMPTIPVETIFLAGGKSLFTAGNNVISSDNGSVWTQITASSTLWSPRWGHTLTTFGGLNGFMFLIGGAGYGPGGYTQYNDVYLSNDGINWIQWLSSAPWIAREGHTVSSFNSNLFLIGGINLPTTGSGIYLNDVWLSPDGLTWTQNPNFPYAQRQGHATVVFNNKLFVIGGETYGPLTTGSSFLNQVISSPDGITWTQEIANAPWNPRANHSSLVFNGRIYVMGGAGFAPGLPQMPPLIFYNDVWSSADGRIWRLETTNAGWSPRESHISLVYNNRMWVIGGVSYPPQSSPLIHTDAWSSADGITWTQQTLNIPNFHGIDSAGAVLP